MRTNYSLKQPIVTLRSTSFWRFVHSVLPLGHRLNKLISMTSKNCTFIKISWDGYWLSLPRAWLDIASSATAPIYQSPRRQNPEFFEILEPILSALPSGCIVDVGANIGIYTLAFRRRTSAQIISFEPDPFIFSLLRDNVRSNKLPAVTIKNVACGDSEGAVFFDAGINGRVVPLPLASEISPPGTVFVPSSDEPEEDGVISVPVRLLDNELRFEPNIRLIKIDCEGYEWNILNGCRDIMSKQHPIFFVELHPKLIGNFHHSLSDVCDLLRSSYRLEFWELGPTRLLRSRIARFAGRYRKQLKKLRDEAQMLAIGTTDPIPDQVYLLALPFPRH